MGLTVDTIWHCYDMVKTLQNTYDRNSIACPSQQGIGCLLWFQRLAYVLPHSLYLDIEYCIKFDQGPLFLTWINFNPSIDK